MATVSNFSLTSAIAAALVSTTILLLLAEALKRPPERNWRPVVLTAGATLAAVGFVEAVQRSGGAV